MKFFAFAFLVCVFVSSSVVSGQSNQRLRESADPYFKPAGSQASQPVRTADARNSANTPNSANGRFRASGPATPPSNSARPSQPYRDPGAFGGYSASQPSATTQAVTAKKDTVGGAYKPMGSAKSSQPTASRSMHSSTGSALMAPMEDDFPASMRSHPKQPAKTSNQTPRQMSAQTQPANAFVNPSQASHSTPPTRRTDPNRQSFEPSRILARVGDQPIFVSDLSVEAMQIIDQHIRQAPMDVKTREARKLMPRLLPKYIQAKLLVVDTLDGLPAEANVEEIFENAGEQFEELMLPLLIKNTGVKSPGELDAYYRALGSSLRTVKQSWAESELVKFMMRKKLNLAPDVSHREIFDYYQANKSTYAIPAKVKWEQLSVRFNRFPSKQEAREAIAKMGDEVVFGAPLAAVAKRSSQGFKANEGGLHDWTTKGSLVDKKMDELLFSIEPEKLSEIIETPEGLAIIRVVGRNQAGFIPFGDKQQEIQKKLRNDKREIEFKKYVSKVRNRIPVEIFDTAFLAASKQTTNRR